MVDDGSGMKSVEQARDSFDVLGVSISTDFRMMIPIHRWSGPPLSY